MVKDEQIIDLMIMPTSRCDRGCWFCMCDSKPEGVDLDYSQIKELLLYMAFERDFQAFVWRVTITGGGEPLLYNELSRLARLCAIASLGSVGIKTSGPINEAETEKLRELACLARKLKEGVLIDDDGVEHRGIAVEDLFPEVSLHRDKRCYERLKMVLDCGFPEVRLDYHQDPRQTLEERVFEIYDVWDRLEKWGFQREFLLCQDVIAPGNHGLVQTLLTTGAEDIIIDIIESGSQIRWVGNGQVVVQPGLDCIDPLGRAERALGRLPKRHVSLCRMVRSSVIQIRISFDGQLFLCDCADDSPFALTPDGLNEALAAAEDVKQEIRQILLTNLRELTSPCDICPLKKKKDIPIQGRSS